MSEIVFEGRVIGEIDFRTIVPRIVPNELRAVPDQPEIAAQITIGDCGEFILIRREDFEAIGSLVFCHAAWRANEKVYSAEMERIDGRNPYQSMVRVRRAFGIDDDELYGEKNHFGVYNDW